MSGRSGADVEGQGHTERPQGLFGRFLEWMALAGGWVVVLLMTYTVADVLLRKTLNRPFSGSLEITEFAMSLIVFLGIAYCGWIGGHVAVDILDRPLDNPKLRFIPAILAFVSAALFAAIAWFTAAEALSSMHRVSNMMRWPHWPFQLAVAFGSAVYAMVLLVQGVRSAVRKDVPS
jgi:TRAP-type transport system small permease protein